MTDRGRMQPLLKFDLNIDSVYHSLFWYTTFFDSILTWRASSIPSDQQRNQERGGNTLTNSGEDDQYKIYQNGPKLAIVVDLAVAVHISLANHLVDLGVRQLLT